MKNRFFNCKHYPVMYLLSVLFFPLLVSAEETRPASLDLQDVPFVQAVSVFFNAVYKQPYVLCADVLSDTRHVSIRASGKSLNAAMFSAMLESHGFEATEKRGVMLICKKKEISTESASAPQSLPETKDTETKGTDSEKTFPVFVYKPNFKDPIYLTDLLSPLVKGTFANRRRPTSATAVSPSTQGGSSPGQSSFSRPPGGDEYLIFSGAEPEIERLKSLLSQIDTATGEVMVKGYLYEISKSANEGSALNMVLSLLKNQIELSVTGPTLGNSFKIKTGSLDFVASTLNSDSNFKVVASPFTRVKSGSTARLQVGQDVPVLGAIVTNPNGQASQSVSYQSSGVIIEVTPRVRDGATDLELFQQVSNFVRTETGLQNSPTLNKREIRTTLSVGDGEVLVIGGLNDTKDENAKSGLWFLPFPLSKTKGYRESELVLILELKKV